MCYHVTFGSSTIKGVCINRREPKNLGSAGARPLAAGARLTLRKYTRPHLCDTAECTCMYRQILFDYYHFVDGLGQGTVLSYLGAQPPLNSHTERKIHIGQHSHITFAN